MGEKISSSQMCQALPWLPQQLFTLLFSGYVPTPHPKKQSEQDNVCIKKKKNIININTLVVRFYRFLCAQGVYVFLVTYEK